MGADFLNGVGDSLQFADTAAFILSNRKLRGLLAEWWLVAGWCLVFSSLWSACVWPAPATMWSFTWPSYALVLVPLSSIEYTRRLSDLLYPKGVSSDGRSTLADRVYRQVFVLGGQSVVCGLSTLFLSTNARTTMTRAVLFALLKITEWTVLTWLVWVDRVSRRADGGGAGTWSVAACLDRRLGYVSGFTVPLLVATSAMELWLPEQWALPVSLLAYQWGAGWWLVSVARVTMPQASSPSSPMVYRRLAKWWSQVVVAVMRRWVPAGKRRRVVLQSKQVNE